MKTDFLKNCVNYISTPVISKNERINHPLAVKIAAIALAIFTCGIFAIVAIGYRLYLQRQPKPPPVQINEVSEIENTTENDESDDDDDDFEVIVVKPSSAIEIPAMHEKNENEEIYAFVQRFLHPYITGQITEANDDPNRKALITLLKEEFEDVINEKVIEEAGLNAYLEVAAMGLYVNQLVIYKHFSISPENIQFEFLKEAVEKALPKDFPNLELANDAIEQKIKDALVITNKRREYANSDPIILIDPTAYATRLKKFNSLQALKLRGEVFFDNNDN